MPLPQRKSPRLEGYDYSQNGAYFVTICTKNKAHTLGQIVGGDAHIAPRMQLSEYGIVAEKYMYSIPGIDKYVIMPNHVHMIVMLANGAMWASPPTNKQGLPAIIRSYKTVVTKELGHSIWQRNYYEHVIRADHDYLTIAEYIDANPHRWEKDQYYNIIIPAEPIG